MGYVNPNSVIAVGTIMPTLATVSVALRFFARRRLKARTGADDFLVLFALILAIGLGAMLVIGSASGNLGQPTPPGSGPTGYFFVMNNALVMTEKLEWSFNLVQTLALGAVKLSVIYFYRRIFLGRSFELISRITIAVIVAWTVTFFFATLFLCRTHFWALWGSLEGLLSNCVNATNLTVSFAATDVATDLLILTLPLRPVWQLQMSMYQRIAVFLAFLLGGITVAAGATRLGIYSAQTIGSYRSHDGIEILTTQQFWSMIEIGLSIVGACAPTLRSLYKDLSPVLIVKRFSRRSSSAPCQPLPLHNKMSEDPERVLAPVRQGAYLRVPHGYETWLQFDNARESEYGNDTELLQVEAPASHV